MIEHSNTDAIQRELDKYNDHGYAIFRQVLDAGLIQEVRDHVDWLLERNANTRPEQLHHFLMQNDAFWVKLISDDRLLDIVEKFTGPDIALFASHYVAKKPLDGQAVLWHQDGTYWPLEPMNAVTFWLAIDDSDNGNGCMRVIPDSHKMKLYREEELVKKDDGTNVLGSGIDSTLVDENKAVDVILKAGDVSVHHPNLIHGSHANTSKRWRRGLTIRYIPTTTRIKTDELHPSAFLLRGNAAPGVNQYNPWPEYVVGNSMSFRGTDEWNKRCDHKNAMYKNFYNI